AEPAPTDHSLMQLAGAGAAPHVIASDFWNPYDFAKAGDRWLVVDAGQNALVAVDATGATSLVYVFPRLKREPVEMSDLSPTEFAEGAEPYEVDAVPTGLAISDNRAWIALFGGFPFTPKGGAVVSLALEGEGAVPRTEIAGLDTPIDVDFTNDGNMLILEMGTFDMAAGFAPGTGRLSIVDLSVGKPEPLLTGLDQPTCVLVTAGGDIYVSSLSGHVYRLKRAG
ncbi:MAG: ScyD/ScyE family protein, partial [Dongiaceae bacterium]